MRFSNNATEDPSSLDKILDLIKGKTINDAADFGNEFQLHLSDEYVLRITGTEVNLFRNGSQNKEDKHKMRGKSNIKS